MPRTKSPLLPRPRPEPGPRTKPRRHTAVNPPARNKVQNQVAREHTWYDKAGNRTSLSEADGARTSWSYDAAYQLTAEHRTGANAFRNTFVYDNRGNRTLKNLDGQRTTSTYDAANQLAWSQDASGRTTYTFDADGNNKVVLSPSGDRVTNLWDYENKLIGVQHPAGREPRDDGLRPLWEAGEA